MRGFAGLVLAVAATCAFAGGAHAQGASADRFWLGLGAGGAGARLTCDLCAPGRDLGAGGEIAVGSYAREDLRVGLELGGWTHDDDGARESVYRVGVVAYLRPRPERGAYLVGGFGWNRYRAGGFSYDAPRVTLGAGWDHPLGSWLRIGNQLTLDASSFGTLRSGDATVDRNVGLSLVRVSVHLHAI